MVLQPFESGHVVSTTSNIIQRATRQDAQELCAASTLAFVEDKKYRPNAVTVSGPPGHDKLGEHLRWIDEYFYIKCTLPCGKIAGGCIAEIKDKQAEINHLFVHPQQMNRGIGKRLVKFLLAEFPHIEKWQLETPDYAARNQHFYEGLGFVCRELTDVNEKLGFGFCRYELEVNNSDAG